MDAAAWAQLAAARRHAQDAADAARNACALIQRTYGQSAYPHLGSLVLDLEEWAMQQTAALSRLMERLRAADRGGPPLQ